MVVLPVLRVRPDWTMLGIARSKRVVTRVSVTCALLLVIVNKALVLSPHVHRQCRSSGCLV
jgi:hypothetical protein